MAVPHVVGAASLLWQKDTSKSKDFIKNLLEESARNVGDKESYGNGLIDYEYAEKQYTKAEEQYEQGQDIELRIIQKQLKLIIIPLMRIKFLEHGQQKDIRNI